MNEALFINFTVLLDIFGYCVFLASFVNRLQMETLIVTRNTEMENVILAWLNLNLKESKIKKLSTNKLISVYIKNITI